MTLRIGIHANDLRRLEPHKETTFLLGAEAEARGYSVCHFTTRDLFLEDGRACAYVTPLTHVMEPKRRYEKDDKQLMDLGEELDVILMRQNPEMTQANMIHTFILERIKDRVLIANDPTTIRSIHTKMFTAGYPDYIAPTLYISNPKHAIPFVRKYGDVVIKPMSGYGGKGIMRLKSDDTNKKTLLELHAKAHPGGQIIQKFIPESVKGDKRITLFDGEPVSALLRIPKDGDWRANISSGAGYEAAELTDREKELCALLGPRLRELGLFFVGVDMLGDYMTEVNYTSPGMIHWSNLAYDRKFEKIFWDKLESRLKKFKSAA